MNSLKFHTKDRSGMGHAGNAPARRNSADYVYQGATVVAALLLILSATI